MDNPDLVVCCVVGDGEAETGPTATAWHGLKYIDPAESGAVLPILHANGFKISERTIFGTMDDKEIIALFTYVPHSFFHPSANALPAAMATKSVSSPTSPTSTTTSPLPSNGLSPRSHTSKKQHAVDNPSSNPVGPSLSSVPPKVSQDQSPSTASSLRAPSAHIRSRFPLPRQTRKSWKRLESGCPHIAPVIYFPRMAHRWRRCSV